MRIQLTALTALLIAATTQSALAGGGPTPRLDPYANAVLGLSPTHYFQLDETAFGTVNDYGTANLQTAEHEGDAFLGNFDPPIFGVDINTGQVGFPGGPGTPPENDPKNPLPEPDIYVDNDFAGFSPDNRSLFGNNGVAVNLGPGTDFANTTMTVAMWFKAPCDPANGNPGGSECQGPPASSGGERLFTNNFQGTDTGGDSDLDDLGHLQIDFGWGANLVVSIDNRFSDPLRSNFQVAHGDLPVKDNLWHHLVVSRDGDLLENVTLVVDGIEITQDRWVDSTDSWGITPPNDARIGTRTTAPHDHTFNGWIDEVALWLGRALTVEESIALYNAAVLGDALPGDFDKDQDVDGDDFLAWQQGFGISEGATQAQGDADGDGDVDGDDFLLWQADFPTEAPSGNGASAIPEPGTMALLAMALIAMVSRRTNR